MVNVPLYHINGLYGKRTGKYKEGLGTCWYVHFDVSGVAS